MEIDTIGAGNTLKVSENRREKYPIYDKVWFMDEIKKMFPSHKIEHLDTLGNVALYPHLLGIDVKILNFQQIGGKFLNILIRMI